MLNSEIELRDVITESSIAPSLFPTIAPSEENGLDHQQFEQLYENYFDQIYQYINYRLGDGDAASDLTSQVFLKAWEKRENFRKTGAPIIAWLYTIARNAVIDDHRSNKEIVTLEEDGNYESDRPTPPEVCELHFETQALKQALEELTDEQYQVIAWKFLDGLSTEEIAIRLGKKEGTIRALQMRALRRLSEVLQKIDQSHEEK